MKLLRLRVDSTGMERSPVIDALGASDATERVRIRSGGVNESGPRTYVCAVTGDIDTAEDDLAATDGILDFEVLYRRSDHALLYLQSEADERELQLRAALTHHSLTMIPPVDVTADGCTVFRVLGESEDLQTAVDALSEELPVDVERVGEYDRPADHATAALTARQIEAVEAALAVGYYDVPREATHEDVAEILSCAPSTASEHLRKAESALVHACFGQW